MTFSIYNENSQRINFARIQMWWNGIDVSTDVQNLGGGIYVISLTPITVLPGEVPITLNMTISASGYEEKYHEIYLAVDPDIINEGEGVFYGPKLDFHIQDCLGRTWQCATIQLDFAMPEKFDIEYAGEDNVKHRPVMIHRTVLGSIERFTGILLEHYSGNLPPWLAPQQVIILPISEKFYGYGERIYNSLKNEGFRVGIDHRVESLNKKIRQAEMKKIPYMIIIGRDEEKTGTITIRKKIGRIFKG